MLNNQIEYKKMNDYEKNHWWFKCLHFLIIRNIKSHFKNNKDIFILDAACGTGGLLNKLSDLGYKNLKGFDLSGYAFEYSKTKNLDVHISDLRDIKKNYKKSSLDVINCSDALYFLLEEELKQFLNDCAYILKSDGILIINIPAFKVFSGIHDKAVGVNKRFNRKAIEIFTNNDFFDTTFKRYWPFLLSPLILIIRFSQRIRLKLFKFKIKSDLNLTNKSLNRALFLITLYEMRSINFAFFGSSLFLVLSRKNNH